MSGPSFSHNERLSNHDKLKPSMLKKMRKHLKLQLVSSSRKKIKRLLFYSTRGVNQSSRGLVVLTALP